MNIEAPIEFEIDYWQERVDAMHVLHELVREERDKYKDAAESLHQELEACRATLKQSESVISRLRNHIAQGIEL